jgi:hypothetical protein
MNKFLFILIITLVGCTLNDEPTHHKPQPKIIIEEFNKDNIKYLIFYKVGDYAGNGGGIYVINHTKETLITDGLNFQFSTDTLK